MNYILTLSDMTIAGIEQAKVHALHIPHSAATMADSIT